MILEMTRAHIPVLAGELIEMLDPQQQRAHVAGPPISSIGVWPAAALAARVPR